MLELNPSNVLCGIMLIETEPVELYCNTETGTIAYEDTIDGSCMCIGEMSLTEPLMVHDLAPYRKGLLANAFAGAVGLIFSRTGVVYAIMDDYTAEVRPMRDIALHSSDIINIDINQEYDEDMD